MRPNTSLQSPERSHFVDLLTKFSDKKLRQPEYNLAERMGHFFDLSSSLTLARDLQLQKHQSTSTTINKPDILQQLVLDSRGKMITDIKRSFIDEPDETLLKVPSTIVGIQNQVLQTYEPYQRFYSKQQLALAININSLRNTVRDGIANISSPLNQLAVLDKTLEQSMASHTQTLFGLAPKLLKPRFKVLIQEHRTNIENNDNKAHDELDHWLKPNGWLTRFYQDLSELLLAELDWRLQPIFGLLEALDEHTKKLKA